MQFEKAYKEMLKGKKIRRREWEHYMHIWYKDGNVKTYKGDVSFFYDNTKILISSGWLILGSDGQELSFLEALDALKNKNKVTNKEWIEKGLDQFLFVDANQLVLCKAIEYDFMPSYQCMMSNDWEIMN